MEAFVITNGRKTLDYTLRSIDEQTLHIKTTVIRDLKWVDALNLCCRQATSDFYFRIDDDMFLHKLAFEYYCEAIKLHKNIGVYECKFWEDWSSKPAGSLKLYNSSVVKKIGFRPNRLGKVDKTFAEDLSKTKYARIKDKSMIGLHACASAEDQIRYRSLWKNNNSTLSESEFSKTFDNLIHRCNKTLDDQYSVLSRIFSINRRYKTGFYKFAKGRK